MKRKKQPTHNYYNKKKIAKKLEKGILALGFLHPFSVSIVFCFAMSKLENEALYALYYWTTYLVFYFYFFTVYSLKKCDVLCHISGFSRTKKNLISRGPTLQFE